MSSGGTKKKSLSQHRTRHQEQRTFYPRVLAKVYAESAKLNGGEGLSISDFVAALKGAADAVANKCIMWVQRIRHNQQTEVVGMIHVRMSAKREYRRKGVAPRFSFRGTVENLLGMLRRYAALYDPETV
jgi:hypothetical protein